MFSLNYFFIGVEIGLVKSPIRHIICALNQKLQCGVTQTGHINQHNFNRGAAAGKTYSFNKVINIKLNESLNTYVNIDVIQNIRGLKFKGVQNTKLSQALMRLRTIGGALTTCKL